MINFIKIINRQCWTIFVKNKDKSFRDLEIIYRRNNKKRETAFYQVKQKLEEPDPIDFEDNNYFWMIMNFQQIMDQYGQKKSSNIFIRGRLISPSYA